jgi:hypothetical protein
MTYHELVLFQQKKLVLQRATRNRHILVWAMTQSSLVKFYLTSSKTSVNYCRLAKLRFSALRQRKVTIFLLVTLCSLVRARSFGGTQFRHFHNERVSNRNRQEAELLTTFCLLIWLTLPEVKTIRSTKDSIIIHKATGCQVPEDSIFLSYG